jgi:endonuclease/exonuclease/phosphatase family metal-dependent hydrolase
MTPKPRLRVLTLNIHKGFTALNGEFALERLKDALRDVEADVAFLQEVVGRRDGAPQGPTQPQFEYLADEVWPHYAYGRNALYPRGHHGNAILSKFPIVGHRHENLSTNRFEQRGLLHCAVAAPQFDAHVHLVCVHFGLTQRGRRLQTERVVRHLRDHVPASAPLVLAGDFNDWLRRASRPLAEEAGLVEAHERLHGRPARTFPVALPLLAVDRIYARGLKPVAARALHGDRWRRLSDHAAVVASFEAE